MPSAVLISQHGTIGNPVALGAEAIRSLGARVVGVAGVVGVEGQSILKSLVMGAPTFQ
jgi:hypothetical protein